LYGSLAVDVLTPALDDPALLEPLHRDGPDISAQALYAATDEWARNADDVIRRRTTLFYRGFDDDRVVGQIEGLMRRGAAQI
jgi:glycerol-3-phosphate dehydrogenase